MRKTISSGLFLLVSVFILFVVLFIAYQSDLLRSQEEEAEEIINNLLLQNGNIKQENEALTEMLFNQAKMYEMCMLSENNRSDHLSRSDRRLTVTTMPINRPSGFTLEMLERAMIDIAPSMVGMEKYFIEMEELHNINCIVLAAIAILESSGGTSEIAMHKNNLAGLGACKNTAYKSAMDFDSHAESIYYLGELLSTKYAPGCKHYGGSYDLVGINKKYAEDPAWADKVGKIVIRLLSAGMDNVSEILIIANSVWNGWC